MPDCDLALCRYTTYITYIKYDTYLHTIPTNLLNNTAMVRLYRSYALLDIDIHISIPIRGKHKNLPKLFLYQVAKAAV